MSKEIVLEVKKLNTGFRSDGKEIKIVKDVSFNLKRASTLAIVGESGCGKSVTVHSIVRLLPPNSIFSAEGVIYSRLNDETGELKDFDLSKMNPKGKEIRALRGADLGMVFQDPMSSLNPVYKVGDQVAEALLEHNKGMGKAQAKEKVLEMFRKLGIPDPENRYNDYPHQFSGGMKQRVVIAIAMINNPEIIIADEPTTALDVTIQAQIMELMKMLQTELGKSVILITHNMGLVAEQADEVCVMYMGRVVEFGSLEQVFTNPSHPYTKALLRSVPVLGLSDDEKLGTIPGATPNPANLGEGCEFADRCEECREECKKGIIAAREIEPGHRVRCVKFSEFKEVD